MKAVFLSFILLLFAGGGAVFAVPAEGQAAARAATASPHSIVGDKALCDARTVTRLTVRAHGLKNTKGNLRLSVYDDVAADFLKKGKKIRRVDVPASGETMNVCLSLPGAGTYALVVLHDQNRDGKVSIFRDGFGASNNPPGLRRPKYREAAFAVGPGETIVDIDIRYLFGTKKRK